MRQANQKQGEGLTAVNAPISATTAPEASPAVEKTQGATSAPTAAKTATAAPQGQQERQAEPSPAMPRPTAPTPAPQRQQPPAAAPQPMAAPTATPANAKDGGAHGVAPLTDQKPVRSAISALSGILKALDGVLDLFFTPAEKHAPKPVDNRPPQDAPRQEYKAAMTDSPESDKKYQERLKQIRAARTISENNRQQKQERGNTRGGGRKRTR